MSDHSGADAHSSGEHAAQSHPGIEGLHCEGDVCTRISHVQVKVQQDEAEDIAADLYAFGGKDASIEDRINAALKTSA